MKHRLLASSPDLESIRDIIKQYFYAKEIGLDSVKDNEWRVSNSLKYLDDFRVIKKANRYRFEEIKGE